MSECEHVFLWNEYNGVEQCHRCGLKVDDYVVDLRRQLAEAERERDNAAFVARIRLQEIQATLQAFDRAGIRRAEIGEGLPSDEPHLFESVMELQRQRDEARAELAALRLQYDGLRDCLQRTIASKDEQIASLSAELAERDARRCATCDRRDDTGYCHEFDDQVDDSHGGPCPCWQPRLEREVQG